MLPLMAAQQQETYALHYHGIMCMQHAQWCIACSKDLTFDYGQHRSSLADAILQAACQYGQR